jgi:dCMP deaminase
MLKKSPNKWDYAHMDTARNYAKLSHAKRARVGAVIVKDNRIISIGYNGMPSGWDNCCENEVVRNFRITDSDGKKRVIDLKTKPEVIHAESNAITKVARSSESCEGADIYTTMLPCIDCAKLIYQAGINRVFYSDSYPKGTAGLEFLEKCSVEIIKI